MSLGPPVSLTINTYWVSQKRVPSTITFKQLNIFRLFLAHIEVNKVTGSSLYDVFEGFSPYPKIGVLANIS